MVFPLATLFIFWINDFKATIGQADLKIFFLAFPCASKKKKKMVFGTNIHLVNLKMY